MGYPFGDNRPEQGLYQYLTLISGATAAGGVIHMNVSAHPGSATVFGVTITANRARIVRILPTIIDGSITITKFGGISALTNGVLVKAYDKNGAEVLDFMDGQTIKTNACWGCLAGVDTVIENAAGDDAFGVRWTIAKGMTPDGIQLYSGESIRFTIQDNLAALTDFKAMVQGVKWDT